LWYLADSIATSGFPDESQAQKKAASQSEPDDEGLEGVTALVTAAPAARMAKGGLGGDNVTSKGAKRPLSQSATPRGPVEKRPKKFLSRKDDSGSSDEDGLKFTFKKRGK